MRYDGGGGGEEGWGMEVTYVLLFNDFPILILRTCLSLALPLSRILSTWLLTKYMPDCELAHKILLCYAGTQTVSSHGSLLGLMFMNKF